MTDLPAETVARLLEAATARGMGPVALVVDVCGRGLTTWSGRHALPEGYTVPLNDHNAVTLARALAWAAPFPRPDVPPGVDDETEALAHAIRAWVEAQP